MQPSLDKPALEDELGDVLEKAARNVPLSIESLALAAKVDYGRLRDALDYRPDLTTQEVGRLAAVLNLNEVGLNALAQGLYPLPAATGLTFQLHPLRMPYGVGVANAYLVSAGGDSAILFDTGASHAELHRAWPAEIQRLDAVFVTHYEAEHIGGLEVVLRESELGHFHGPPNGRWPECRGLGEGQRVRVGDFNITAFSTPGHAAEHNCYLVEFATHPAGPALLISGDLIFAGSLGGGYFCCQRQLTHSGRIMGLLADDTVIAPGHGPLTTAANERRFNPFLAR
ncbi:MBL fold metallo-hydrolase [Opitutus sp. GAS368]|jgi:hydroxyacylglutathione hydrolase|uniref:MBL fold metallo-hydrolase n=1 Tax=Opitutus sp. GAS368 TaxID=1882749 RepID=UPI00087BB1A4|nr:MBL fold metallo-hydrolase [Opitutus sp. GAS368]SDS31409.1 Glyoxylase, beta-lactamase superfamily II [Opitutus sp. GAS368]